MSRIQKGLNRGRLRKSGSSTNTPLSRSPHHGKLSPIKTRRLYKSYVGRLHFLSYGISMAKQVNVSRCTICKTSEGDLTSCTQCHKLCLFLSFYSSSRLDPSISCEKKTLLLSDHLSKCILYSAYMIARVAHVNWLCPKCIRCSSCHLMVDDPTNVECVHCLQAWHGACQPPGSTEVDRQFFCKICLESVSQPEACKYNFQVLYDSPYPDDIKSVQLFFVCAYCLKPFSEQNSYFVHQDCCPRIAPPGREIYRDSHSNLSFFEVDGAVERTYCRYLCLLAMLFISSKTSHNEVGTFYFYILTKNDENGCRILGYFSKEKNPSRNNNLSCLLTIPSEQRHGYGHLLIDMSYQLSSIERKVGSPEHPLSDLGLFTYRKYWKSSILCYLRSRKDSTNISIKSMSLQTRIHPTDIVNELMRNNLLIMKDGNYFIKTWKLAFKFPLSALRRRVVDASRIKWAPDFDVNTLDPYKLNHYA
ncbi:unnamed protein product [Haemonchus placei]|uniref:Histone acetyltransferase n=1 Tax=Haemonchus placei TaxID=6290 RepID=A0A0N4W8Z8_HAEPC|nr:unnamed protein product [Haemonchus placei]